ncbi:MAG: cytochrome c biogenesis protein CcsA [Thaumarchaeota archaeon]|nr:cytochrome c biogenesis protein CcsA [Nitrososphaerota archaeon]MCL5316958.1 cytochrome c biogenesis protein CcsA [Nitrososphaerota archaeon]
MPRLPEIPILIVALALYVVGLYTALIWAPVELTLGESYRVFYLHVPAAWVSYLALGLSLIGSIAYLKTRKTKFDLLAEVTAVLGVLFASLTLVLGSIWANVAWGTYWNWDPRETTTLVLWISYAGYLALRTSIENVGKRAVIPAIYNIFAFSTVPLSYISVVYWQTLHPRIIDTSQGLKLSITPEMVTTLMVNLLAATLLFIYLVNVLYKLRRSERILEEYEELTWR